MNLFKETLAFLKSGEFFSGVIDRMFALAVTVIVFGAIAWSFVYKPIILLYLLIAGLLVMGWFMLYFVFPELHEWIHTGKAWLARTVNRLFRR